MSAIDPLAFDDPKFPRPHDETPFDLGWGFCRWCAFLVPEGADGRLTEHRYTRNGPADMFCTGSFREPTLPVPVEADPLVMISLRKDSGRAGRRAYWQKRRWLERAGQGTGEPKTGAEAFARLWMGLSVGDRNSSVIVDDYGEEIPDGDHTD